MADKSEKLVKSIGKIAVTEMIILFLVALLTQTRNVANIYLKAKLS